MIWALLSREGACLVNIPAPARYAVHKLIVFGEREAAARAKAVKDIEQAAALAQWHLENGPDGDQVQAGKDEDQGDAGRRHANGYFLSPSF